ncbi:hypothetical protein RO3G_13108 [Rhizopus delemar RA 99-880]|uniref:Uncharacterized protein n=1 Tax=Rhizopus delemar (strain RA 99-880 / ATCC MYA-4621 / FGSC 9543 / NRRL 43880) TaxID=246409 RepID=I1CIW7_RHIO9|nr:hypothetical protein RO3G_13108 [Rhizopus delemar RA 99-880]|eukprot:EIE88397.1 hypothetical protein RO3G_13108 [Rhizopus delemar RA 99-880]
MSFNSKAEVPYQLYKIQTLKIPTSLSTYTHIEESLEYLKSFKNMIDSSLASEEDTTRPMIYQQYTSFFKPTINCKNN